MSKLINILLIFVCNLHLSRRRTFRITFDMRWQNETALRQEVSLKSLPKECSFHLARTHLPRENRGADNPTITANPFHGEHVRFRHRRGKHRQQLTPHPIPATCPFPSFRLEGENHDDKYRVPRKSCSLSSIIITDSLINLRSCSKV